MNLVRFAVPVLLWCRLAAAANPYYLLTYSLTPGVDVARLTPEQQSLFRAHGAAIGELHQAGSMYLAGHTTKLPDITAIALVKAKDEASALAMGQADPAVKAGLLKVSALPFDLPYPPAPPPLLAGSKANYDSITRNILQAARKMPEDQYGFRPAPTVRTFAQILAHVAEAQYIGCGAVRGDTYSPHNFEQTRTTRTALLATLETAFAYCQEAFAQTPDTAAADPVALFNQKRAKLTVFETGTAHLFEHYGNLVTYLRIQGIVPPSSEQ